jgi:hypothetical protein
MAPAEFSIARSITIAAPAAAIYPHIIDLKRWQEWSPWEGLDPDLRRSYSDDTVGVGAKYAWQGNRKVGKGGMVIQSATEPTEIQVELHVFGSANIVTFTLTETAGATKVDWVMTGPQTLKLRMVGVFMNMDKTLGKDFDKGLAGLKAVSEGATV